MDKGLKAEVQGRSLKREAVEHENKLELKMDSELVAFRVRAENEGMTPKQIEMGLKEIIDKGYSDSLPSLLIAVAKDALSDIKIINKWFGRD